MDFSAVVSECAKKPELVRQIDRLYGTSLSQIGKRTPIESMIDKATGFDKTLEADMVLFTWFVYEFIWSRLPDNCFVEN
jgi:hypothetical protein